MTVSFAASIIPKENESYHAEILPGRDVVLESDGTTGTAALADGQVLVESLSALNRRSIGASSQIDIIYTAIAGNGPIKDVSTHPPTISH